MKTKQVQAYIEKEGSECPFCGSREITGITDGDTYEGEYDPIFGGEVKREVVCSSCGKSWREYYRMHDIEELDADGCAIENEEEAA
jgi:DNA-directed RNA polymerase subunit RPC12/RpoP